MPQAERYDPADDLRLFDGGEDVEHEEEGSRLALLLVLALIVLGAFGGVVYLAYSQGVKQGREEAPRPMLSAESPPHAVAPPPAYKDLKVYKPPASDEELANQDAVPPPPTAIVPKTSQPAAVPSEQHAAELPTSPGSPVIAKPASSTTRQQLKPQAHVMNASPKEADSAPRAIAPALAPPQPVETSAPQPKAAVQPPAKPEVQAALTPATTAPPTAATPSGNFTAQIGAYKSEAEASASWRAYKSAHASAGGYAPDIVQVELPGKGTWYRLRIGSFASSIEANALCTKLKAEGGSCFPAKR